MFRLATVAVAIAVLLTGCSDGSTSGNDTSPDVPAITPKSPDEVYLDTVRQGTDVSQVSDSALLIAGHSACTALGNGADPMNVLLGAMETAGDAGIVILGSAVTTLCREHQAAVQELAQKLN